MDATAFDAAALAQRSRVDLLAAIRATAATALAALLLFAAWFFLARRLAGALNEPLSAVALIGLGLIATISARLVRILQRPTDSQSGNASVWTTRNGVVHVSLPILALAVSLPGSSVFGLLLLWLMILGEEAWSLRAHPIRRTRRIQLHPWPATAPTPPTDANQRLHDEPAAADWLNPTVSQRVVYRRTAEGRAAVEGWVRTTFAPEQRTAFVHVAFCPPFAGTPEIEAEPLDGPTCDVRPTLVLPWGVRCEIKLTSPTIQSTTVVLGIFAAEKVASAPG